jgi:hypothetical protein
MFTANQTGSSSRSASGANSYEFVEFDVNPNTEYEIKIYAFGWTSSLTYYGLAWHTTSFPTN